MSFDTVNSIYCSKSMAFVSDEPFNDEQSGWTSYLDTTSSTTECYNSESLFCNSLSVLGNVSSMSANNVGDMEEETHGSTVSDASSGRVNNQPKKTKNCGAATNSNKCMNLQQTIMGRDQDCRQFGAQFDIIRAQLEDTATSSPISTHEDIGTVAAAAVGNCFDPSMALQYGAHEDVSEKFKVLETLIPHLKEVAVHANEEDILNAIIDHVHALELKVELLSKIFAIYRS